MARYNGGAEPAVSDEQACPSDVAEGDDRFPYEECAYYRGEGSCSFGCYDEPECMTCEPREGWTGVGRRGVFSTGGGTEVSL